jgi:tetratricopeptide (TPR) repeat protein
MLYQMATGQLPFSGKTEIETLHGIMKEDPSAITSVVSETPPDVERVVRKALEKEPEHRYQHADDMASDLRTLQRDLDSGRVTTVTTAVAAGSRRSLPWGWIVTGVVVVIALLAMTLLQRDGESPGIPAASAEGRTIGIMGFENLSDPADTENLSRVLMGLVTTDLAETGGLSVASSSKILAAIRQAGGAEGGRFDAALAPEAAKLAGANVMLVGQVNQVGERLILAAELVDVDTGNTLGSLRQEAASSAEMFTLAGDIAQEVRGRLGVAEETGSDRIDLARTLTDSPEAYRQYAAGELALHQREYPEAIERFSQAVQHDSTFALAYYRLGMASTWRGESAMAAKASGLALRYAHRLPDRWQVIIQADVDYARGEFDRAHEILTDLLRSEDIPDAYNLLGEVVTHASRYWDPKKQREYFEKALEIDPTFKVVFFHLIEAYIAGDDMEAAERLVGRYRSEDPEDGVVMDAEVTLLVARGRYDEVVRRVEEDLGPGVLDGYGALAVSHWKLGNWERAEAAADAGIENAAGHTKAFAYNMRGISRVGQGRFTEGLADFDRAVSTFEGFGSATAWSSPLVAEYHINRALALRAMGDIDGALRATQDGIDADRFVGFPHYVRAVILFIEGRMAEGEAVLGDLQAVARESFSPLTGFWVHLTTAEKHLAVGDTERALSEVRAAAGAPPEHRDRKEEFLVLARVLAAGGDRSGAIAAYRKVLESFYAYERFSLVEIPVLYELAKLEEAEGDLAAAREHYRRYLASWGETTVAEVPDAKARLKALEAGS